MDEYVQYLEMNQQRGLLEYNFAKMITFVEQKGILELLDTKYESYR